MLLRVEANGAHCMPTSEVHFAQRSQRSVHVARLLQKCIETAQNRLSERVEMVVQEHMPSAAAGSRR
jgi:hypothetical protein